MFEQSGSRLIVKFGEEQAPLINVQGGACGTSRLIKQRNGSLLEKDTVLELGPVHSFPVVIDCSCLRSSAVNVSARSRSHSIETQLANRFCLPVSHDTEDEDDEKEEQEEDEEDESLQLTSLFSTLQKFSSRLLNPLQARSIARIARCYKGKESLTVQYAQRIKEFLDCDSPPIQDAVLIAFAKLMSKPNNVEFLLTNCSDVLDLIFSLASDAPTLEVHISALKVIQEITSHADFLSKCEQQLEDIIYPLIHAIVKNRESSELQKCSSLGVMKNLSQLPIFASKVKQDVLSQLNSIHDSSKIKGLYLEILHENLQISKQRISADILDNSLLPVLTSMLIDGPCKTQCQSFRLLTCIVEDSVNRMSLLSRPQTVALCILCAKYSKCRRVLASACQLIEKLLSVQAVTEARKLMECNSESLDLEGGESEPAILTDREERLSSPIRKKSRAEALMWRRFDEFIDQLVFLLERQGCILFDRNISKVQCELSPIGNINIDQLSCISYLIGCFNNLCYWPLNRPRKSRGQMGEVEEFLAIDDFGLNLDQINHHHAINLWGKLGPQVMALFRQMVKRVPAPAITTKISKSSRERTRFGSECEDDEGDDATTDSKKGPQNESENHENTSRPLESMMSIEEVKVLRALVKFVFVISVVSCHFKKSSKPDEQPANAASANESVEKKAKAELAEKEVCAERKILRRGLAEEGMFYLMGKLIRVEDDRIKTWSAAILRLCLQPVNEKAQPAGYKRSSQYGAFGPTTARPQSARSGYDGFGRQSINQRIFHMGKPGIGQRAQSSIPYSNQRVDTVVSNGHGPPGRQRPASAKPATYSREATQLTQPGSAKYSLFSPLTPRSEKKPLFLRSGSAVPQPSELRVSSRLGHSQRPKSSLVYSASGSTMSTRSVKNVTFRPQSSRKSEGWTETETERLLLAPLNPGNNLSQQCCERALLASGEVIFKGIFSPDMTVRKSSLLLLHDLVLHSKSDVHMNLSKLGCIPKLVDFLRINDDNELLEITGLTITRMLVTSDRRICQLFNIHGGSNLLMALLHKHPNDDLKQAISSTLNTVNYVMHTTPNSEFSDSANSQPSDIWGYIMQRWEGEDKVVQVLKQFL